MKIRKRVGAIICRDNKFLLVKSNKHSTTHYYDAGGGIEENETDIEAIHREISEELNTSISKATFVQTSNYQSHSYPDITYLEETYIVELRGEPKPSSEIDELRWVTYDESFEIHIMNSTKELIEIARKHKLI